MKTLIIDSDAHSLSHLESALQRNWPGTAVLAKCTHLQRAFEELVKHRYDLLFLNVTQFVDYGLDPKKVVARVRNSIFMATDYEHAAMAINCGASGYLLKPVQEAALNDIIGECLEGPDVTKMTPRGPGRQSLEDQIICVPTMEGAEFLKPHEIIRCEGLQKCTRIVTYERKDIISSYNIGVFREVLVGLGFVQTHRSHIINLRHIRRYHREGTIFLTGGDTVPLSRRRKVDFFRQLKGPCRLPLVPE